ncbi:helicase [Tissierella sp. P1]|uniref:SNF2 helicase associated domain-containing protein n=1 Tax=Tissierella sp. P1 TaxID=1280483 RepID=UPI000BA0C229|nr:SNF2 helicase associated domain-containing protein [Tissierella sp. P1]OZV11474.1 helicase [Tissierella sp. P1]
MSRLTDEILIDRVELYDTYEKGKQYYESGKVREVKTTPNHNYYVASVVGGSVYKSIVEFNSYDNIVATSCTCGAYKKYHGDCKHIVALLILIMDYEETSLTRYKKSEGDIKNILHYYSQESSDIKTPVNLEINFKLTAEGAFLDFRIGVDKLYVVRGAEKFISDLQENKEIEFGKKFKFSPEIHCFNSNDKKLIDFITLLYENYEINFYNSYGNKYNSTFKGNAIYLGPESLKRFFELMKDRKFNANIYHSYVEDIIVTDEDMELNLKIEESKEDLLLRVVDGSQLISLTPNGEYFFYKDKIYQLSQEKINNIMPIYNEIIKKETTAIRIEKDLKETFISEVLPAIRKHSKLIIDKNVEESIYSEPLHSIMYFDKQDELILGKVIFNYGNISINPFSSQKTNDLNTEKILLRDIETERTIMMLLEQGDFKVEDGGFYLEEEEQIYDFITDIIPELQKHCEVYYSESFKKVGLISSKSFKGGLKLDDKSDILEFNFDIEGVDDSEFENILGSLREKKKYYKLKNGSFLSLDNKAFDHIVDMLNYLDIEGKDFHDGNVKIPKFRTLYLDKFIRDRGIDYIKKNVNFKRLVQDINDPDDIEYELPKGLTADLRDYQKFGFKWLKTLSNYGFGGVLADEMGLGKTIQMISFLLSEKEEKGSEASIVIVPTSLVYNWEEEVKRFSPSLKTLVIVGSKDERNKLISTIKDYDLIITSYPLIRRDIGEYRDIFFRYCILDEAQYIKNQESLSAKSVKNIKAKNYFALTGTPMENSLSELWSIFDFLMPGYLLTSKKFIKKYEWPIVKKEDNEKLKELSNQIKPFILRRSKKEVLKELPDKIEQKIVVDMLKDQKKLYKAYLQAIKGEIDDEINAKGYSRSHIKILAGLTRLRQICCHPGIFVEGYNGGSGKLDSLEEIVAEAVASGHRILIFSQFTTMLEKIKKLLEYNKIKTLYLDGGTPIMERSNLVMDFNKGIGDVFLISLKAGGTGLNLPSADMVIHFDPWWNPAVEDQATDRAHRIGQEKTVQVIKLVAKGTIEEKIFKLQEKKKEMIDKVITDGETLISKLSEEEIISLFDME